VGEKAPCSIDLPKVECLKKPLKELFFPSQKSICFKTFYLQELLHFKKNVLNAGLFSKILFNLTPPNTMLFYPKILQPNI